MESLTQDGTSVETAPPGVAPSKKRIAIAAAVLGCFAVFGLDGLLFHTNLYPSILDPDSTAGLFELILRRELKVQSQEGQNVVLTLGNSRLAYSRKLLDRSGLDKPYHLRTAGIAGSNARTWYYMLRDLDPTRRRYRAIVLAVDDYDDEDNGGDPADDIHDLHYLIARLRWADVFSFAGSFDDPLLRRQVLRGTILKGIVLQDDIRAFLARPIHRFQYVELCNREYSNWDYDYLETTRSMAGLAIDWTTLQVTFPPDADDNQKDTVKAFLVHKPNAQTGRLATFRLTWFGRIIDAYRGSDTKIVFLHLPRGPIPRPDGLSVKLTSSIRELATRPNVLLSGEHAFDSLEHPELFKDGMHLNREGINRFSVLLEQEVRRVLRGPDNKMAVAR